MKRDHKYEELISAYIDGILSDDDLRFVEETLLKDPVWRKRYEQMRILRSKMSTLSASEEKSSLWPSLSRRIQQEENKSEKIELVPAKLIPVVTVLAMIVVGLGSFLITRNWDTVTAYFGDTRAVVEDIYEQGIVRGALQPLFEGVTNDDLIKFAFSGVLEIPEAEGQGLKVESETGDQFELEFADAHKAREAPSLSELFADLNVTTEQMYTIDSVLTDFKNVVRTSAFLADGEEVIISPELAGLDKFILASVAEHLNSKQRIVLNKVLNRFNPEIHVPTEGGFPHFTAYTASPPEQFKFRLPPSPGGVPQVEVEIREPERTAKEAEMQQKTQARTFIVVKPDTVITQQIEIHDFNLLMAQYVDAEEIRRKVGEELARALHSTRIQLQPRIDIQHDDQRVQVITRVDRPRAPGEITRHMVKIDSLMLNNYHEDHFVRLRELTKLLQHRYDIFDQRLPEMVGDDTIRIPQHFNIFDESFEKKMRQLELDLNRLQEELEKMFDDPEKLMFMRDSVYFHIFSDTLDR